MNGIVRRHGLETVLLKHGMAAKILFKYFIKKSLTTQYNNKLECNVTCST